MRYGFRDLLTSLITSALAFQRSPILPGNTPKSYDLGRPIEHGTK